MNNDFLFDFIVPCGRVHSDVARRVFGVLSRISINYDANVIVVGYDVSSQKKHYSDKFKWVDTEELLWPSLNRNLGVKYSDKDFLMFIDDDCYLDDESITNVINMYRLHDNLGVLGGRIISSKQSYVTHSLDYAGFAYQQSGNIIHNTDLLVSAFMCIPRDLFNKLNGFDENLRVREDIDLVRRVLDAGSSTIYVPQVKIFHDHGRTTWEAFFEYMYFNGKQPFINDSKKFIKGYSKRLYFKSALKNTLLYLHVILFPLYVTKTFFNIFVHNRDNFKRVLFHSFGILFGLFSYEVGRVSRSLSLFNIFKRG